MKNKNVYILGAGAMARETYQIYKDAHKGNLVKGFIVNGKIQNDMVWDKRVFPEDFLEKKEKEILLIGGIGNPLRKDWIDGFIDKGFEFDSAVHKSVLIGYNTKINNGSIICAEVTLTCDISIGRHVVINNNATVNHDCVIADYVTVGPGVNIGGRVNIGEGSFIGIGAVIKQDCKIGQNSFIGAGSVVIKDIPDGVLAYGCPAKPQREIKKDDWKSLI